MGYPLTLEWKHYERIRFLMNKQIVLWYAFFVFSLVCAPILPGIINKVKAFFAGRKGPSVFQLYYDLAKLVKKEGVTSASSGFPFPFAPYISLRRWCWCTHGCRRKRGSRRPRCGRGWDNQWGHRSFRSQPRCDRKCAWSNRWCQRSQLPESLLHGSRRSPFRSRSSRWCARCHW